jgi:hypothetical protein
LQACKKRVDATGDTSQVRCAGDFTCAEPVGCDGGACDLRCTGFGSCTAGSDLKAVDSGVLCNNQSCATQPACVGAKCAITCVDIPSCPAGVCCDAGTCVLNGTNAVQACP